MTGSRRKMMIPTGILELDELLSPDHFKRDTETEARGGFYVPVHTSDNRETPLTPVVVIEGPSASGKTVLALQMATSILWNGLKDPEPRGCQYNCFYYSLEQRPWALIETIRGFDYFQSELIEQSSREDQDDTGRRPSQADRNRIHKCIINLEDDGIRPVSSPKLFFPRLSPRPIGSKIDSREFFKERYAQLETAVREAKSEFDYVFPPIFFIDSLSAFGVKSLSRDEVHRLYNLFRSNKVPVIFTLERQAEQMMEEEKGVFTAARYLADVVIRLYNDEEPLGGYFLQHLEIAKTNYNRHILGRQLYKIRTKGPIGYIDPRIGLVLYPSLHFRLSKVILKIEQEGKEDRHSVVFPISRKFLPVGRQPRVVEKQPQGIITTEEDEKQQLVPEDMFIVVSGHLGGHKLALACNLLIWRLLDFKATESLQESESSIGLIISLSEEKAIKLHAVALHPSLGSYRNRLSLLKSKTDRAQKMWETEYGNADERQIFIKSLNLRMGSMMPEEFVYIIDKYIEANKNIKAIVFSDTALLRTRFPLLSSSTLFIPTLVDTIKERGLFSVFIDPVGQDEHSNMQLLAAADCRILLEPMTLSAEISHEPIIVKFHVENVRGKNYDRSMKLLQVFHHDRSDQDILVIADSEDELKKELECFPESVPQEQDRYKSF